LNLEIIISFISSFIIFIGGLMKKNLIFSIVALFCLFGCSKQSMDVTTPNESKYFTVKSGKIYTPGGSVFVPAGINAYYANVNPGFKDAVANSSCQPLLSLFPSVNIIRINMAQYYAPSEIDQQIQWATAKGIVCIIENHQLGVLPYTGQQLTDESAWYAQWAAYYKNNPYVWFGTFNEPAPDYNNLSGNGMAISAQHQATYNAVRNAGNGTIVTVQPSNPGTGQYLNTSVYKGMVNVVCELHFYGWLVKYYNGYNSTDQNVNNGTFDKEIAEFQHQFITADGLPPVFIGEYGDSTSGTGIDYNSTQILNTVWYYAYPKGIGSAIWNWYSWRTTDNDIIQINHQYSEMGQPFANWLISR
jgi:Cellulase (glycosyl hydrolase family 5)